MFFFSLTEWTLRNVILRVVVAFVLGALIGIDRGAKRRGGGGRTDAAVCMGAAVVMLTSQYMGILYPDSIDISRMASQVVSGVGFLGAGSIIVSGHQVKGLTYAAGIWICACIGLAVGIGFVDGAVIATLVLLAGLHIVPILEESVYRHSRYAMLYVEASERRTAAEFLHQLKMDGCKIDMYDVDRSSGSDAVTILATIRIPGRCRREEYIKSLEGIRGILSIDTI